MNTDYMKGFLLTALGVLVLSFDALLIRLINSESFDLLFWRGLLLSVAVFCWCRFRKPEQVLFSWDAAFIRSALLFAVSAICFVSAITLTSVANVLVIISAQPLFAAVMARIFLREKSSRVTWAAIIVSMLGIGWVLAGSWQSPNLTGDLIALLCGVSLSAKFVNDRANSKRDMTPALILSGLIIAAISAIFGSHPRNVTLRHHHDSRPLYGLHTGRSGAIFHVDEPADYQHKIALLCSLINQEGTSLPLT
mgnify:CR=1 FL=1